MNTYSRQVSRAISFALTNKIIVATYAPAERYVFTIKNSLSMIWFATSMQTIQLLFNRDLVSISIFMLDIPIDLKNVCIIE